MVKKKFRAIGATLGLVLALALVPVAPVVMAGEEGSATGNFTVGNSAPDVSAVQLYSDSNMTSEASGMTPQTEYYLKVTVNDANGVNNIAEVKAKIYYDSAGNNTNETGFITGNNQTCAILTWNTTGWFKDAGAGTSWGLIPGNCSKPSTGTGGDWKFAFKPGKVATESISPADWDLHGRGTDNSSATNGMYCYNKTMDWYGEITLNTATIAFGNVIPGSDFAGNNVTGINATYVANGVYDERVSASTPWTGTPSGTATLNETASPGANEFSLKADDTNTLANAVNVTASPTYATIDDTSTQTFEAGDTVNTNTQWLKLGTLFTEATYTGTIYYQIANG